MEAEIVNVGNDSKTGDDEDQVDIPWIEGQFQKYANSDGQINEHDFKQLFPSITNDNFLHRLFRIFDSDSSGYITITEYVNTISQLLESPGPDPKIQFLFKIYDSDGNGNLSKDEFKQVLMANIEESGLKFNPCQLHELTDYFFFKADKVTKDKVISFDEFKIVLSSQPGVYEGVAQSVINWIIPKKPPKSPSFKSKLTPSLTKIIETIQNNCFLCIWSIGLILINFVFIFGQFVTPSDFHDSSKINNQTETEKESYVNVILLYKLGKGAGQSLNFHCSFIIFPILLHTMTFLKMHGGSKYFPIGNRLFIHGLTGVNILTMSLIHGVAHLLYIKYGIIDSASNIDNCFGDRIYDYSDVLFGSGNGELDDFVFKSYYPHKYQFISGFIIIGFLTLILIPSLMDEWIRKSTVYFKIFFWSHLFYLPFWIGLLFFHTTNFWKWFLLPGTIFLIEKIHRYNHTKPSVIQTAKILPSQVLKLIIQRPKDFLYNPGDYVNVCIPSVSCYEYHSFPLSSCPEVKDELWIHISSLRGDGWLKVLESQIRKWIDKQSSPEKTAEPVASNSDETNTTSVCIVSEENEPFLTKEMILKVFLDGPYSAPVSQIFHGTEHAILIGTGLNVAPFASVLSSASKRYWASHGKVKCTHCQKDFEMSEEKALADQLTLRKMDFIWLNRHQSNFEWFISLLGELEAEQIEQLKGGPEGDLLSKRFLDFHLYLTSASKPTDMKTIGLTMAMDIVQDKKKKDYLTGLKTRTHPGRPNFRKLFQEIQDSNQNHGKGKITLFYSGGPKLGKLIKELCEDKEFRFEFVKQYF